MQPSIDTTQNIHPLPEAFLSTNLDFQTTQLLDKSIYQEIAAEIQLYLELNFLRLVNDENFLLAQVQQFLDKRYGLNLPLDPEVDYHFAAQTEPADADDFWSTPEVSPPAYYWGLSFNPNTSLALKLFLQTLADNRATINSNDIPNMFREICQHLFAYIHSSHCHSLNLPDYYVAALQTLNLSQIILALFPQPKYQGHIVSMSVIPDKLKNLCYCKYLHWSKQSLKPLAVNTLWLTTSKFIGLAPERNSLLVAVAGVREDNKIKPTLVGLQQTALPQSQNYQYLLQQLKDRQMLPPQLIIHDEHISGQEIRAIFPNAYTWLVSDHHQSMLSSPLGNSSSTISGLLDLATIETFPKTVCALLALSHKTTSTDVNKKSTLRPSNSKLVVAKKKAAISQNQEAHDYIKMFRQLIRPMEILGLAVQAGSTGRTSPLAIGILWQMLQLSIEQMPVLSIAE